MNENITPETEVQNTEITAGEMLRNARTTGRRKREILTIAKQLCIREEFLQALENGDYASIPEPVYILGFARNYAMELGLDPDEIIAKIKREMGMVNDVAVNVDVTETPDNVNDGGAQKVSQSARALMFVRRKWKLFAAALVALIVVSIVAISLIVAHSSDNASDEASSNAVESVQVTAEPGYSKPVREQFGIENRGKANVILQAIQDGWVKIEDARGNTVFSRVLVAGDVYYVPAGEGYTAIFGNAGGIDIWADGALMEKVGPSHTRKSGIALSPSKLKSAPRANTAE